MEREETRGSSSVLNVAVCLIIVVVVAALLYPVFVPAIHIGTPVNCQSNMKQIGSALKMYLSDWGDTYPTNRNLSNAISPNVKLTSPGQTNADGTSRRFQYGVNWVEGLYNYIEQVSKSGSSSWQCPQALKNHYPKNSDTVLVSYVFNRNLVEKKVGIIKYSANLMEVREFNGLLNSELRPTNETRWSSKTPPVSPFLTRHDAVYGRTNPKIHGNCSNILFADGHVKLYAIMYFPKKVTKEQCWDTETKQWYNFNATNTNMPINVRRTIAITP